MRNHIHESIPHNRTAFHRLIKRNIPHDRKGVALKDLVRMYGVEKNWLIDTLASSYFILYKGRIYWANMAPKGVDPDDKANLTNHKRLRRYI